MKFSLYISNLALADLLRFYFKILLYAMDAVLHSIIFE